MLLAGALSGCRTGPPDFSLDPVAPMAAPAPAARFLDAGSPATPPPGTYRFARLREDGVVEARDLVTVNGPGPWLAYVTRTTVSPFVVAEVLSVFEGTPRDTAPAKEGPCVLAFQSRGGTQWEGCARRDLAERILSIVPPPSAPDPAPACGQPFCQLRVVRRADGDVPEGGGDLRQDVALGADGAFWCAKREDTGSEQAATLRVARGRIAAPGAAVVFDWLGAGIDGPVAGGAGTADDSGVMVRGTAGAWTPIAGSAADGARARWRQIAEGLPEECRAD